MSTYSAGSNGTGPLERQSYECHEFCVSGPGNGFGYHSWAHHPSRQFKTYEEAEIVAKMCDDAFEAGRRDVQREIKKILGIK